jgi:putative ABC transport system permease protein
MKPDGPQPYMLVTYSTFKARGYPDRFLCGLVLQELLILSSLEFLLGPRLSNVVYQCEPRATSLTLAVDPTRKAVVYVLTAGLCIFSEALEMGWLRLADPEEII